jgi:hypothetical protein
MQTQQIINDVLRECDACFHGYDDTGYGRITEMLSEIQEPDERVIKALKLAEAGPTLSSPRFAYPHIKSALTEG